MTAPGRHRADRQRPALTLVRPQTDVEATIPTGIRRHRHRSAPVHGSAVARFATPGEHTQALWFLQPGGGRR